ncbi:hypothetical protein CH330_07735 [candidate division WOR-3 bacterium JGI_Cruoil_03_51_56]|uniref:Uncharacterized protein n=1 Tax=candidate division WOR-3 bacterium JGI_Cruoil_03_51_56 TaxID=1973747 RepID=A0A235BRU4_UNCW3|nr:MAG: hypothetical protein CH330_07735 [candidate division WOR-3 bacterium JGI_Cruoil_03_51_56]
MFRTDTQGSFPKWFVWPIIKPNFKSFFPESLNPFAKTSFNRFELSFVLLLLDPFVSPFH